MTFLDFTNILNKSGFPIFYRNNDSNDQNLNNLIVFYPRSIDANFRDNKTQFFTVEFELQHLHKLKADNLINFLVNNFNLGNVNIFQEEEKQNEYYIDRYFLSIDLQSDAKGNLI